MIFSRRSFSSDQGMGTNPLVTTLILRLSEAEADMEDNNGNKRRFKPLALGVSQ